MVSYGTVSHIILSLPIASYCVAPLKYPCLIYELGSSWELVHLPWTAELSLVYAEQSIGLHEVVDQETVNRLVEIA